MDSRQRDIQSVGETSSDTSKKVILPNEIGTRKELPASRGDFNLMLLFEWGHDEMSLLFICVSGLITKVWQLPTKQSEWVVVSIRSECHEQCRPRTEEYTAKYPLVKTEVCVFMKKRCGTIQRNLFNFWIVRKFNQKWLWCRYIASELRVMRSSWNLFI